MANIEKVEVGKNTKFSAFMTEFWFLQNKYINGDNNNSFADDLFWESFISDSNDIAEKYVDTPFHHYSMSLLLTFSNELERKFKIEREEKEKEKGAA